MSEWRGRLEDSPELESALDWVTENWQVPVVVLLLAFMLWNRVRKWQRFLVDGEVLFGGNDPWYHYRTTTYTVRHWPATMPFDPWTHFPHGTASGQFGTLFDQIVATVALVLGLGSPSEHTIRLTLLFAPAVFGVLAGLPTYVIGRRLGGRIGGVAALTVLAFSVGSFLQRSMVGFSDHHVAEALFMTVGVLATMVAVSVADREKPIYEQVVERNLESLRPTLVWSVLAGFAVSLYLWIWPFGVLLIGILGAFFLVQLSLEFARGRSPEHTAFAGAVALGVVGVTMTASMQTSTITASDFSFLHPLLAFAVAAGCVFMAWLAREWEARGLDRTLYPVSVAGIIVAGVVFVALVLPNLYGYFANQLTRILGLGFFIGETAGTVGEITPLVMWSQGEGLGSGIDALFGAYGFAFFAALAGAVFVVGRSLWSENVSAERVLVAVWFVFTLATTFTQVRFMYYLVFPVAALTGHVAGLVVDAVLGDVDVDDVRGQQIEAYQVITVVATLLVLLGPLLIGQGTAVAVGGNTGPGPAIGAWDEGLESLRENTPEVGNFNDSGNPMEYYGTYPAVENHDYEPGQYGIMSWWDYGHWITAEGHRIPVANPFQQGSDPAARFLIAQNESRANEVLANVNEDDAKTRYVAVDWKMVTTYGGSRFQGKFFAPPNFVEGVTQSDFYHPVRYSTGSGGSSYFVHHSQNYYETTAVRLYKFHGSAVEPEPYVVDWSVRQTERGTVRVAPTEEPNSTAFRQFESMQAAREYVADDPTSSIGGIAGIPSQRVPAMEHYRLVDASRQSATSSPSYNFARFYTAFGTLSGRTVTQVDSRASCGSSVTLNVGTRTDPQFLCLNRAAADFLQPTEPRWVKFFERVPGGTVRGEGPANATVTASVEMEMPGSNETFTYHQQARTGQDGEFTMTMPYSTTGYDDWGPANGHTDVAVRANGSYRFSHVEVGSNDTFYRWTDTAEVTEAQVIGEDTSAVTVDMERSEIQTVDPSRNRTGDGQQSGNETGTTGTDGDQSGSDATGTDGNQTGRIARPVTP